MENVTFPQSLHLAQYIDTSWRANSEGNLLTHKQIKDIPLLLHFPPMQFKIQPFSSNHEKSLELLAVGSIQD